MVGRNAPRRALELERLEPGPALVVRQLHQRAAVEIEQVEYRVDDRHAALVAPDGRRRGHVHPALQALEARPTVVVEGNDLAVEHRLVHTERADHAAHLRIGLGDVVEVAALKAQPTGLHVGDRAHPVPFDLERPVLRVARERACRLGHHRDDPLGHRLPVGIRRWIHPVDHPVIFGVAGLPDREQAVAAVQPLAVEGDLDLAVLPLVYVVRAVVPDRHRARAVLALGYLPVELEVLEGVVLGADGQPVIGRIGRDAVGNRPGREHPVVLEAQIPVQAGGVVLLDDKPVAGGPAVGRGVGRGVDPARGLGCGFEIALAPVGVELL